MTTLNVLIKGETNEQCVEEAMKIAIDRLVDWDKATKGFHVMSKNNHVIFVTQKPKEECNNLLDETLRYFSKHLVCSEHNRDFFLPENFYLKQEQNNSVIHFVTLDELLNNLQEYKNDKEIVIKGVVTDEFKTYQILEDNEIPNQLFTKENNKTYFVTAIDRIGLESMKIFSFDELFQYTIIL